MERGPRHLARRPRQAESVCSSEPAHELRAHQLERFDSSASGRSGPPFDMLAPVVPTNGRDVRIQADRVPVCEEGTRGRVKRTRRAYELVSW